MTLDELRVRLNALDQQLLTSIRERQDISQQIARVKRETGYPLRDYAREREVILRARGNAKALGVSEDLAEELMTMLIRESLTTQEQDHVAAHGKGSGRSALVIGGGGKMGGWFSDFLSSQGFRVTVADPAASGDRYERVADWRATDLNHDFIIVATPMKIANAILLELAQRKPPGIVFDVGSLKSPLRSGLMALRDAGCRVTSIHPMFGPDTELLSQRHVVFIDLGCPPAIEAVQELFASTMAQRMVTSLDEHDRLIAYILGLSHALNIAFFTALAESGEAAPRLATLSSTTFDAQLAVATKVSEENPHLYFEIQSLNDFGQESLQALRDAVERLWRAVTDNNEAEFVAMMTRGHEYLAGRQRTQNDLARTA